MENVIFIMFIVHQESVKASFHIVSNALIAWKLRKLEVSSDLNHCIDGSNVTPADDNVPYDAYKILVSISSDAFELVG